MVKKRGLGKPLNALLAYASAPVTDEDDPSCNFKDELVELPIDSLQRGKYQPRREMDPQSLEDLANSIRTQGIIQPLIVRPVSENRYEIIAGERRFRAAKLAELASVPVIVRHIPDEAALAIALIENIQRENLNPVEEAIALQRLIEEFEMTHQEVAAAVGKSRTSVTNLLRLLSLPEEVKTMLANGQLEMGHARTLITLPANAQVEMATLIVSRELSVRETETMVRRLQNPSTAKERFTDPDLVHLQDNLSKQFKLKVAIQCNAKGKGKLIIHYKTLKELDTLLSQIRD